MYSNSETLIAEHESRMFRSSVFVPICKVTISFSSYLHCKVTISFSSYLHCKVTISFNSYLQPDN